MQNVYTPWVAKPATFCHSKQENALPFTNSELITKCLSCKSSLRLAHVDIIELENGAPEFLKGQILGVQLLMHCTILKIVILSLIKLLMDHYFRFNVEHVSTVFTVQGTMSMLRELEILPKLPHKSMCHPLIYYWWCPSDSLHVKTLKANIFYKVRLYIVDILNQMMCLSGPW